jgi:hypothetical protein
VRMIACEMSRDLMGIRESELISGLGCGGVASFLADSLETKLAGVSGLSSLRLTVTDEPFYLMCCAVSECCPWSRGLRSGRLPVVDRGELLAK